MSRFFSRALFFKECFQLMRKFSFYLIALFFLCIPFFYYFIYSDFFSFSKLIPINEFFLIFPFIYIILIPFLSMLSWANEGTFLEWLPFSSTSIFFSKWLSSSLSLALFLLSTLVIPFFASFFIYFDWAIIFTSYAFLFVYGIYLISLSQALFVLVNNKLSAFILLMLIIVFGNRFIDSPWAFKGIIQSFEFSSLLLLTFLFFIASVFIKERKKGKKLSRKIFLLIFLVFILALINLNIFSFKIDLTKNKAFSLSNETRQILASLEDDIRIKYYLSPSLEKQYPQVKEVKDFLKLLEKNTNTFRKKNIGLSIINPEKLSEEEIRSLDLKSQQIQINTKGKTLYEKVFSSIRLQYLDKNLSIDFALSLNGLEYALFSRIQNLIGENEKKVYLLLANDQPLENYSFFLSLLIEEGFIPIDVETHGIDRLDETIPLIIIGSNENINDKTPYIESFVMRGGSILFFLSKTKIAFDSDWTGKTKNQDALLEMLDYWGFEIQDGLLIDLENKAELAMQNLEDDGIETIDYALWQKIEKNNIENPLIDAVKSLDFFWPSPMKIQSSENRKIQALFLTSEHSLVQDADEEGFFVTDPFALASYRYENQLREQFVLAALGEGSFPGYYSSGKSKPTHLIVVPDEVCISNAMGNIDFLTFVTNSLLYVTGDESLIGLKNKTQAESYFIADIERMPGKTRLEKTASFYAVLGLFPFAVIGLGIFIYRKKR